MNESKCSNELKIDNENTSEIGRPSSESERDETDRFSVRLR